VKEFKIIKLENGSYAIKKRVFLFFYIWICWCKLVHDTVSFEIKLFPNRCEAIEMVDFLKTNSILRRIVRELLFEICP